jgi:hypothetical protein
MQFEQMVGLDRFQVSDLIAGQTVDLPLGRHLAMRQLRVGGRLVVGSAHP